MFDLGTHPWMRGLFGDDDIGSVFSPDAEVKRMLRVEAAWTRALGHVTADANANELADRIENTTIAPSELREGFSRDGVPAATLVSMLKTQLGPEHAHLLHKGLTSQDVMDTSLMLAFQDVFNILTRRLETLDTLLHALQTRCGVGSIMALTRMQPALETTVSELIDRWRRPLPRLLASLEDLRKDAAILQWGGPIGVRDHPNATHLGAEFARQLHLSDPGHAWHTDRSIIADIAHALIQIVTLTGKIGEDIALMAALGPAQITLSGGGSSAMAHKNNPIKAETLITLSDHANLLQHSLTRAARHEGFRSGRAWVQEWMSLPQLSLITGASTLQVALLIQSIQTLGIDA